MSTVPGHFRSSQASVAATYAAILEGAIRMIWRAPTR
jgi:hypothetical protein